MPRPYHCVDETIDLDRIVVVTDLILHERSKESPDGFTAFHVRLEGVEAWRSYSDAGDHARKRLVEEHRKLLAAWAGEQAGDVDE